MTIDEAAERLKNDMKFDWRMTQPRLIQDVFRDAQILLTERPQLLAEITTQRETITELATQLEISKYKRGELTAEVERLRKENGMFRHELALACESAENRDDAAKEHAAEAAAFRWLVENVCRPQFINDKKQCRIIDSDSGIVAVGDTPLGAVEDAKRRSECT